MNKLIKQALDSIGIKSFYITKESYEGECVVYNYISKPSYYADNKLQGTEYTILLNVYSKSKIEETKSKVINVLNAHGIRGGVSQKTMKEENGMYNTPIQFNGFMREERLS